MKKIILGILLFAPSLDAVRVISSGRPGLLQQRKHFPAGTRGALLEQQVDAAYAQMKKAHEKFKSAAKSASDAEYKAAHDNYVTLTRKWQMLNMQLLKMYDAY